MLRWIARGTANAGNDRDGRNDLRPFNVADWVADNAIVVIFFFSRSRREEIDWIEIEAAAVGNLKGCCSHSRSESKSTIALGRLIG